FEVGVFAPALQISLVTLFTEVGAKLRVRSQLLQRAKQFRLASVDEPAPAFFDGFGQTADSIDDRRSLVSERLDDDDPECLPASAGDDYGDGIPVERAQPVLGKPPQEDHVFDTRSQSPEFCFVVAGTGYQEFGMGIVAENRYQLLDALDSLQAPDKEEI